MRLPAQPASAAQARQWMRGLAAVSSMGDREDAALLCVSELVANVARHAHSEDFTVTVVDEYDGLHIEVADDDPRMGPSRSHVTTDDEQGRGLGIVDSLAVEWGIRAVPGDGKCIWLKL